MKKTETHKAQNNISQEPQGSGLLDQIIKQAEAEAARLIEEAQAQADKKKQNGLDMSKSARADAEKRAAEQADRYRRQKDAALKIELKKLDLQVYEKVHTAIMDRVMAALSDLAGKKEYRNLLISLIAEGVLGLDENDVEVIGGKAEQKVIDGELLGEAAKLVKGQSGKAVKLRLSTQVLERQGVVLSAKGGRLIYNNRLEARIDRRQNEIRKLIAGQIDFSVSSGSGKSGNDTKGASA